MSQLAPTSKRILEESLVLSGLNESQVKIIMTKVDIYIKNILWDKENE